MRGRRGEELLELIGTRAAKELAMRSVLAKTLHPKPKLGRRLNNAARAQGRGAAGADRQAHRQGAGRGGAY